MTDQTFDSVEASVDERACAVQPETTPETVRDPVPVESSACSSSGSAPEELSSSASLEVDDDVSHPAASAGGVRAHPPTEYVVPHCGPIPGRPELDKAAADTQAMFEEILRDSFEIHTGAESMFRTADLRALGKEELDRKMAHYAWDLASKVFASYERKVKRNPDVDRPWLWKNTVVWNTTVKANGILQYLTVKRFW